MLTTKGIPNKLLQTSHAFHSAMMDPIQLEFEKHTASIPMKEPEIPIFSTLTGKRIADSEMTKPSYWTNQLRFPVRFADAIKEIL